MRVVFDEIMEKAEVLNFYDEERYTIRETGQTREMVRESIPAIRKVQEE
jgi:hypothetical protein